ncbi:hypothetical protein MKQ68_19215 [Chitinophaga horti]|uniref:YD repeat-containing protein n=1 Tax=Chitinophaga horti TaxID=2920382 RepID=A0ABY6J1N4_9BACT|nr:hypothetical protein [Chitinophaga horti]UYQ92219.1 hypothetical protein MKQ68_19215 [Chitinophaga horti]
MMRQRTMLLAACCLAVFTAVSCKKTIEPETVDKTAMGATYIPTRLFKVSYYDTTNGELYRYVRYEYNDRKQVSALYARNVALPHSEVFHIKYDPSGKVDMVFTDSVYMPQSWKYEYDVHGNITQTLVSPQDGGGMFSRDTMLHDAKPAPYPGWENQPTYRVYNKEGFYNHFYTYTQTDELIEYSLATHYTFRDLRLLFTNTHYRNPEYQYYKTLRLQDLVAQSYAQPPHSAELSGATVFDKATYILYGEYEHRFNYEIEADMQQRVRYVYYINGNGQRILERAYEYL